jgi:hypothetical protein
MTKKEEDLAALEAKIQEVEDEFIAAGRGLERFSEILKQEDPLSRRYQELHKRKLELRAEINQEKCR